MLRVRVSHFGPWARLARSAGITAIIALHDEVLLGQAHDQILLVVDQILVVYQHSYHVRVRTTVRRRTDCSLEAMKSSS